MSENKAPGLAKTHTKEFIILIAFLMSIVAISIDALLPALGVIGIDLGVSHANDIQYVISFIFIGMTFGQLICGPLSDAKGRKKILYCGIFLYLIGSVMCYLAKDFEMLLIGRLVQGLGVAGPYVTAVSVVRDRYSGRDMAQVMSVVMMIFIMVPAIAPSIGQGILMFATWRYIFLLYIVYSIAICLWIFFRLEETLPPEKRIPFRFKDIASGFKEVLRNRTTICYTASMGIIFGSLIGYLNSSQQIFQVQFAVGDMFSIYFGGLALTLGIASLTNSRFVQKYGMRLICFRANVSIIIASLIFLIVNVTMPVQLWMFLLYAGVLFFCFGLMFGNLNAIAMEPMGHIAGIASAVIGALSSTISLVIGIIIGQMYDNTLLPIVSSFLVFGCISTLIITYENADSKLSKLFR